MNLLSTPSCKDRHWNCAPIWIFISCDQSSCTNMHWKPILYHLVSFDNDFGTNQLECRTWTDKNVFLCFRQIQCVRWKAFLAAQHGTRTRNDCWLTGERETIFHSNSVLFLEILQNHSNNSCICEVSFCIVLWLSLKLYREFANSQFLNALQFSHFVNTSNLSVSKCFLFHDQFFL